MHNENKDVFRTLICSSKCFIS